MKRIYYKKKKKNNKNEINYLKMTSTREDEKE